MNIYNNVLIDACALTSDIQLDISPSKHKVSHHNNCCGLLQAIWSFSLGELQMLCLIHRITLITTQILYETHCWVHDKQHAMSSHSTEAAPCQPNTLSFSRWGESPCLRDRSDLCFGGADYSLVQHWPAYEQKVKEEPSEDRAICIFYRQQ